MKVLISAPDLDRPGGVASYHKTLKPYLGCEVEYFVVGARAGERGLLRRMMRLMSDYVRFAHRVRSQTCDLVCLNPSLLPNAVVRDGMFLRLAKAAGKKVMVFFHGWDKGYEQTLRGARLRWFRSLYARGDAFWVNAEEYRDCLRRFGLRAPVYVETHTVDDREFPPQAPSRRRDPDEPFHILFLARIESAKGIYQTLDAFAGLQRNYPAATLTVAGDGGELAAAKQYASQHGIGSVTFTGYLRGEAKQEAFERAHCYLFPTMHGEGMPHSVLEAMAHGLPVITRPMGGLRDFFEHERMGFLTSSTAPETFAALLERLIADPALCAAMGHYNWQYARERFAASRVAERLEGIFRSLRRAA